MKIGLIPLDERPVNTRYPRMLAEIGGAELVLPPPDMLSHFRSPADTTALQTWLADLGATCDVLIVSCEMLGYGSLINSRISHETAATILARLEGLRELKSRKPALRIFGFNLITRISRANDATEEPDYWAEHGANMYRLSQFLDQIEQGMPVGDELERLRGELPTQYINDFLRRRLRNHTVNLGVLQLAADGVFDVLVLSSDDTSQYGLGSREKRGLSGWAEYLKLDNKLLLYPGADEVGSVLVARAMNQQWGKQPRFRVDYAVPGGEDITAAFEDSAVRITVERQILAAGGEVVAEDGDIYLMVNPPRSSILDWPTPYSETEVSERVPYLRQAVDRLQAAMNTYTVVAVADVAQANGADWVWMELLDERDFPRQLQAYSAWNTAGNALGTTIAQAGLAWGAGSDSSALRSFLAHRLIEDWLYQAGVRDDANQWIMAQTGQHTLLPDWVDPAARWIESNLTEASARAGMEFQIVPGSLYLPWRRTFEIDFELKSVQK